MAKKEDVKDLQKLAIKKLNLKTIERPASIRYSFSKVGDFIEIPNLLEVQKKSYDWFMKKGFGEVLRDISPIVDHSDKLVLEFFDFYMEPETKYDLEETRARMATYSKRLIVKARLINKETGEIKEQEVFLGDFPVMTDAATFIINGAERVIVSQLIRSPGCYFTPIVPPSKFKNKKLYGATIMPVRGAWIEFETDISDVVYVRIDKTRKLPITTMIRALGLENAEDIIKVFGDDPKILNTLEKDSVETHKEAMIEIYKKLRPGELQTYDAAKNLFEQLFFNDRRYDLSDVGRYKFNQKLNLANRIKGKVLAKNAIDPETGEILAKAGEKITLEKAREIQNSGLNVVYIKTETRDVTILGNGMVDITNFVDSKIAENLEITENVSYVVLKDIIENTDEKDLEKVIKERKNELMPKHVTKEDIFASISYILNLEYGLGHLDNIDHLGNRRVRSVGELLQNQFRIGLARLERVVRERMTIQDLDSITPQTLINVKPVTSSIKEFFGSSQLSQFMDQTNPLAEMTNKRRISALGPGGLTRERAGFEVRDVHYTHYGRLCPIESPEGPNIGLISSLSTFAKINKYGFIETPYRKVDLNTHKVTDEVEYMSADVEDNFIICQATEPLNKDKTFENVRVRARILSEIKEVPREEVEYIEISPKQLVSVGTAMIPFLENDDASRALMGANMQKQAVPLITTDSPMVGTGIEYKIATDSKNVILAKNAGTVTKVVGNEIVIKIADGSEDVYELRKFKRTNGATCINQRPIVREGDKVEKDQAIADGMSTQNGELALGKNVLIAFATWEGYNYEDAILLNERIVKEDVFTSVHIEEYECESRITKLGDEEITRDVPNVGDDALKNLDEDGIIRIGATVKPGDILVGKITPKGETELTAEEKLLRAIFGDKSREVRDSSLRVPHGEAGTIVDVRRFKKEDCDELKPGVNEVVRIYIAQKRKITVGDKMAGRHGNKGIVSRILPEEDMPYMPDGTPIDVVLNPLGVPSRMNIGQVLEVHLGAAARMLGMKFATPVFDGATDKEIENILELAGISRDGKTTLYDGRTGDPFDKPVTVGVMYMLKLHHLVDDKIHARSTGSYSLVTQQPLGGKAQFGGQRFGEMEVWALEAYGASHTLQEMITVKSDDVTQRQKTYEAIVKGENMPEPGIPESFKVLVRELQGLGLDISLLNTEGETLDLLTEEEIESAIKDRTEIEINKRHKNAKLDEDENEEDAEDDLEIEETFNDYDTDDLNGMELVDEDENLD